MAGTQSVVFPVTDKTEMRRYAPDSIKFADAKPSKFTELKVGDQLSALGDRGMILFDSNRKKWLLEVSGLLEEW